MTRPLRRSALVLTFAIAGAGAVGCASSSASKADSYASTNAAATLARLDEQWSAAATARDVPRLMSYYAHDAVAYPPGMARAVGSAQIDAVWSAFLGDPSVHLSWSPTATEVARSGDIAFTAGTYTLTMNAPNGVPMTEHGKYLCTWRKQADGSWKATHDMWNADSQ